MACARGFWPQGHPSSSSESSGSCNSAAFRFGAPSLFVFLSEMTRVAHPIPHFPHCGFGSPHRHVKAGGTTDLSETPGLLLGAALLGVGATALEACEGCPAEKFTTTKLCMSWHSPDSHSTARGKPHGRFLGLRRVLSSRQQRAWP